MLAMLRRLTAAPVPVPDAPADPAPPAPIAVADPARVAARGELLFVLSGLHAGQSVELLRARLMWLQRAVERLPAEDVVSAVVADVELHIAELEAAAVDRQHQAEVARDIVAVMRGEGPLVDETPAQYVSSMADWPGDAGQPAPSTGPSFG